MSLYFAGEKQSLEDILKARDKRVEYQEYLLGKYRGALLSYKLNIPGPVKYNLLIKKIFDEGFDALEKQLAQLSIVVVFERSIYKHSGPEYFGVFNIEPETLKKVTSIIEESHPLGRLYDFDVLNERGAQLSRQDIGIKPRKCLICDKNAFECGRSREHGIDELIGKIESMAHDFFGPGFKE